ncbi:flagellar brake protein [Alteribacillus sp. HJP-4]|uniref:flagellar brake protein n=1 Tax=Alteribacillus sp. HJP-4 TaxID=2775394 RepID=UPI0035CD08D7
MIDVGNTIHLELSEPSETGAVKNSKYRCRLIDTAKGCFIIEPPVNEKTRKTVFFMEGTQFQAWFIGFDQAVYSFQTEVKSRRNSKINALVIYDPGREKYYRLQRRNYVRIDTSIDFSIQPAGTSSPPVITTSLDISGGGLAVLLPAHHFLKEDMKVKVCGVLHFQDGEICYVHARCKVIRILKEEIGKTPRASLQFIEIPENDRQKIIRYCFEQQMSVRNSQKSRNR